ERLRGVEVAFGERICATRESGIAVDDGHLDEVVAIRGPPDEAARLILDDVDASGRIDVSVVVGERSAHQSGDAAIHFHSVDLRRAMDERVLDVDATARSDDQDARS